jgi:NAD(P)H-dependent FMN reductase
MPRLLIITGSTRPGRQGPAVTAWFRALAEADPGFETVEVADLGELNLPLFDEPNHPRLGEYVHDHTKAWSAIVSRADAVVWVTPEYIHSFPASVKNAIDFLASEWRHKAVGVVSYGGIAAGTRAVQALKPVFSALMMIPVQNLVNVPFFAKFMHDGTFEPDEDTAVAARAMLAELAALDSALSALR